MILKAILLSIIAATVASKSLTSLSSEEIVNTVNKAQTTWKAGRPGRMELFYGRVSNLKKPSEDIDLPRMADEEEDLCENCIPKSFDARTQWPMCAALIGHVRDQSNCRAGWALAAVDVLAARLCIATQGKFDQLLSAGQLMSCCSDCGDGCEGGYEDEAWKWLRTKGVPTGGDYNSSDGCQPYPLQPCSHWLMNGTRTDCRKMGNVPSLDCVKDNCTNANYKIPFKDDIKKAKKVVLVGPKPVQIMKEIMKNGPVQAWYHVFADFCGYQAGVYHHVCGDQKGEHSVKIIGWGEENYIPYWLAVNSWNTDWGDKGLFKIRRGTDECGFESRVFAGTPEVHQ